MDPSRFEEGQPRSKHLNRGDTTCAVGLLRRLAKQAGPEESLLIPLSLPAAGCWFRENWGSRRGSAARLRFSATAWRLLTTVITVQRRSHRTRLLQLPPKQHRQRVRKSPSPGTKRCTKQACDVKRVTSRIRDTRRRDAHGSRQREVIDAEEAR
ncbi:uncharacterized protein LOC119163437 isoform X2 [Rhipicephalus microplus]|uniref:uncharacterized protein LOC119163437 isoform X2 n=1 Tax=Rhipicephalus microplus TaxID=6941 RepID=UPI003F6B9CED